MNNIDVQRLIEMLRKIAIELERQNDIQESWIEQQKKWRIEGKEAIERTKRKYQETDFFSGIKEPVLRDVPEHTPVAEE